MAFGRGGEQETGEESGNNMANSPIPQSMNRYRVDMENSNPDNYGN